MFDEACNELRDIIRYAVMKSDKFVGECVGISCTDEGLAITIGDKLYGVTIFSV